MSRDDARTMDLLESLVRWLWLRDVLDDNAMTVFNDWKAVVKAANDKGEKLP